MPNALLLAHKHGETFHLMPRAGMALSGIGPFNASEFP